MIPNRGQTISNKKERPAVGGAFFSSFTSLPPATGCYAHESGTAFRVVRTLSAVVNGSHGNGVRGRRVPIVSTRVSYVRPIAACPDVNGALSASAVHGRGGECLQDDAARPSNVHPSVLRTPRVAVNVQPVFPHVAQRSGFCHVCCWGCNESKAGYSAMRAHSRSTVCVVCFCRDYSLETTLAMKDLHMLPLPAHAVP